jgi:hypothetical protein
MEDFSQSRGDDDLFDDEIIPFENPPASENLPTQLEQVSLDSVPPSVETVSAAAPAPQSAKIHTPSETESSFPGFRQKSRGRGGLQPARGGAPRKPSAGLEDSKWASVPADSTRKPGSRTQGSSRSAVPQQQLSQTKPTPPPTTQPPAEEQPTNTAAPDATDATEATPTPDTATSQIESQIPPAQPPTGPSKTPAVRGDRTATGGLARPKLTEEELSAKLAAAKERSQNLAAAHARAQADAASFEERERQANEKRAAERKERRVMEGEREKNRLRKLGNREGREWDRDKEDAAVNGRGVRGGRGGAYAEYGGRGGFSGGPTEDDDLRQYEWHEDRGRGRGRGRAGRNGRGRGRGGAPRSDNENQYQQRQQPDLSAESDFPSLPGASATKTEPPSTATMTTANPAPTPKPQPRRLDSGGGATGGTWAEQVESSELDA